MYRIKVIIPIDSVTVEKGYFSSCYRTTTCDGPATFIGYIKNNEFDKEKIKLFKKYSVAKRKIKFLEEKVALNGYLFGTKFEIEEVKE